jgi:sugar/nucleoside kinase (ribokinase family)
MPHLDLFLCNAHEAWRITGEERPQAAAHALRALGAKSVIVKMGAQGCWLECQDFSGQIPALQVEVVDTTGAGDAFAAGLIQAILDGKTLEEACRAGNASGARMVGALGALGGWLKDET